MHKILGRPQGLPWVPNFTFFPAFSEQLAKKLSCWSKMGTAGLPIHHALLSVAVIASKIENRRFRSNVCVSRNSLLRE